MAKRAPRTGKTRTSVLGVRVPPEDRELIERAAVVSGMSVSAFIAATVIESIDARRRSVEPSSAPSHAPATDTKPAVNNPPQPAPNPLPAVNSQVSARTNTLPAPPVAPRVSPVSDAAVNKAPQPSSQDRTLPPSVPQWSAPYGQYSGYPLDEFSGYERAARNHDAYNQHAPLPDRHAPPVPPTSGGGYRSHQRAERAEGQWSSAPPTPHALPPLPDPEPAPVSPNHPEVIHELKRIGNNVNQLAHAANGLLQPDSRMLVESFQHLLQALGNGPEFKKRLQALRTRKHFNGAAPSQTRDELQRSVPVRPSRPR
ncbi:MAG: plasmid mobilization relaxosome protein MobC [Hyphomicrobiaceae bacterium]